MKIYKKLITLIVLFVAALSVSAVEQASLYNLATPNITLLLRADVGGELKILYYGPRITEAEYKGVETAGSLECNAYPAFGLHCTDENAISVKHADGNLILQLQVGSVETLVEAQAVKTIFHLKDTHYPFTVDVCYRAYHELDMIETWVEISHAEKLPVVLKQFASGYLPFRQGEVWISHMHGDWGNEAHLTTEPLTKGLRVIKNTDGVRNSHSDHPEMMFSLDGKPRENEGPMVGAALCWSGNYSLRIDTDQRYFHHFFAGINELNSEYKLGKGERFVTPTLAFTYTQQGMSGVSRNFHSWARRTHLHNGMGIRDILLNSWEGVYMDITQEKMEEMMHDIAYLGGELFVMDDGWFGDKYPRRTDSSSLGDWTVDKNKLPLGIKGLTDTANREKIHFGIWLEPEMTNIASELYEQHPDWVIVPQYRPATTGRGENQLVLDLSNPKVQDFIFRTFDDLLIKYPAIYYIKWDANMSMMNYASNNLSADKQSHLAIEFHRGLIRMLERIRAKYPKLVMQDCSSGGGRVNYGLLPYFEEFWTSDVTDALERVYIQWGTSMFFPSNAMACHVSASPNHQTGRIIPIKYRFDVAMSGRLGMEIQPSQMKPEEYSFAKRAIATYKQIRPIVQLGNLYRLLSPYDKQSDFATQLYVSDGQTKAVFFGYKIRHAINQVTPIFKMAGLNPNTTYRITELNKENLNEILRIEKGTYTGSFLMNTGIWLDFNHEYSSRVLLLEAI